MPQGGGGQRTVGAIVLDERDELLLLRRGPARLLGGGVAQALVRWLQSCRAVRDDGSHRSRHINTNTPVLRDAVGGRGEEDGRACSVRCRGNGFDELREREGGFS